MQYTSFASKDPYKPPTTAFFNQGANAKKPKYVPGGEWAADDDLPSSKPSPVVGQSASIPQTVPQVDSGLQKTGGSGEGGEEKPKSRFIFIKKKTEGGSGDSRKTTSIGVLEYSEFTSDQ